MTKALVCSACLDIRALDRDGEWTHCDCGSTVMRWLDPERGTVRVCPDSAATARVLGLNNRYFVTGVKTTPSHVDLVQAGGQWEWWRRLHAESIKAPGYIFDESRRACWATVVRVNETSDIAFDENPAPASAHARDEHKLRLALLTLRDLVKAADAWRNDANLTLVTGAAAFDKAVDDAKKTLDEHFKEPER